MIRSLLAAPAFYLAMLTGAAIWAAVIVLVLT